MKHYKITLCAALSVISAGCSLQTSGIKMGSSARFENAEWQQVFESAEATLREYFGVEEANRRSGVIQSIPIIVSDEDVQRPLGRPISSPRQTRKIAAIHVEPRGGVVYAHCGVLVQRSEAVSHLAYSPQRSIDDTPNQTPLQESEGRADQSHMVWNAAGYDRKLEQELLAAVRERHSKRRSK